MPEHRSNGAVPDSAAVRTAIAYSVATLGFESPERRALRGVLGLSEQGEPIFRAFVEAPGKNPDIVIVNADEPAALKLGKGLKQSARLRNVVPLFVSRTPDVAGARYVLSRPMHPAQLLAILERIVTEEHGFVPKGTTVPRERLVVLSAEERAAAVAAAKAAVRATGGITAKHAALTGTTSKHVVLTGTTAKHAALSATAELAAATSASTALVIESSLPVRMQMRKALEPVVSRVDFAASGAQVLERIESQCYSLIFVDADLSGQDAYGICRRIRNHPLQRRTPVVLLTSEVVPSDRVKGRDAGCDSYLLKPVSEIALVQVIAQLRPELTAAPDPAAATPADLRDIASGIRLPRLSRTGRTRE